MSSFYRIRPLLVDVCTCEEIEYAVANKDYRKLPSWVTGALLERVLVPVVGEIHKYRLSGISVNDVVYKEDVLVRYADHRILKFSKEKFHETFEEIKDSAPPLKTP